jgi:hypothetical protein
MQTRQRPKGSSPRRFFAACLPSNKRPPEGDLRWKLLPLLGVHVFVEESSEHHTCGRHEVGFYFDDFVPLYY